MTILPVNPAANATPAALLDFLEQCRALALAINRPRLVSITLEVPALDPLAVLESIFEPDERHFYVERPAENLALAGAEAVVSFSSRGPQRFADCQRFIDATLADAIVVGDQSVAFSGPHFFTAYTFFDEVESGEPFESASIFVPRWQVALANGRTTAVANLVMPPDARADLRPLAEKVLRAHQKFARFEYNVARAASPCDDAPASPRGTGCQPVSEEHGQAAHATAQIHGLAARATQTIHGTSPDIKIRQGAYLPHWTRDGATYAVTFRLADSLPQSVLQAWLAERDNIILTAKQLGRPLSAYELERLDFLHSEKIETYLDSGAGECLLCQDNIAQIVRDAFLHFDGERYTIHAWCVMPNHAHVVVQPHSGHDLGAIMHSWKSFTAHAANRALNRSGNFWQAESYDHLIRDEFEYSHAINYVLNNPVKAGLKNWKWFGPNEARDPAGSSAGSSGTGVPPVSGRVARASRPCENASQSKHMGGTPMPPDPTDPHGRDAHATRPTQPIQPVQLSYPAAVTRALDHISRGAFHKIVLARALDFTTPDATAPFHPLRILNTLRERFTDCHSFSFANGRGQSFIGASPERLLRVRDRRLLTEALAGSAPRGATASEDAALGNALLNSEKDLREQRHVLDSIHRRLEPLGLTLTHPDRPGLRKLANVQHLHTPIEATLPDDSKAAAAPVRLLDVLARLHPTPAVGGTPREAAVAHIRELENFPRGLYAGAIGWLDSRGNGEFFVALRSALIDGPRARLYAGAGIVAGSTPDKEYDETEIKFRAIRDALLAQT